MEYDTSDSQFGYTVQQKYETATLSQWQPPAWNSAFLACQKFGTDKKRVPAVCFLRLWKGLNCILLLPVFLTIKLILFHTLVRTYYHPHPTIALPCS